MKKSSSVPASLIVALAGAGVAAVGCGSGGYDDCVDQTGRIVADSACRSGYAGAHYIHRNVSSGGFGGSGGGFFGG